MDTIVIIYNIAMLQVVLCVKTFPGVVLLISLYAAHCYHFCSYPTNCLGPISMLTAVGIRSLRNVNMKRYEESSTSEAYNKLSVFSLCNYYIM